MNAVNRPSGGVVLVAFRGLVYHLGAHVATSLGIAVAAMVLAGALLVGDSLRSGLRERALGRLGWVDGLLITPKPFGEDLAKAFPPETKATAALLLAANLEAPDGQGGFTTVGHVTLLGVENGFFDGELPAGWPQEGCWLGADFPEAISGLTAGIKVVLRLGKPGGGPPRESLLGQQAADQALVRWELPLRGAIPGVMARFSPKNTQSSARLAVVPLNLLQGKLGLEGKANTLMAQGDPGTLNQFLGLQLRPEDFGLTLGGPTQRAQAQVAMAKAGKNTLTRALPRFVANEALSGTPAQPGISPEERLADWYTRKRPIALVESSGLYLSEGEEAAVLEAALEMGLEKARVLVHLANKIESGGKKVPYSVVAAVEGPASLLPELPPLGENDIALLEYKGAPWAGLNPGAAVSLTYFPVEDTTPPKEASPVSFRFAGLVGQTGFATDSELSPAFPGITDKLDMASWQAPFPIDLKAVTQVDENYWKDYRGAPKAYVSLKKGRELWGGRFGVLTSIRLRDPQGKDPGEWLPEFRKRVRGKLDPAKAGLQFQPIREQAITASKGSSDFGGLFLGFSSFLLVSGLLLAWLLMSLGLERRRVELGILAATGWRDGTIRKLLLIELGVVSLIGAVGGALAGAWVAPQMIHLLLSSWPDPELAHTLRPVVNPASLMIGALSAWGAGLAAAWFAARRLSRQTPLSLLQGVEPVAQMEGRGPGFPWVSVGLVVFGLALLACSPWLPPGEPQAGGFFTAGLAMLSGGLGLARQALRRAREWPIQTESGGSLGRMALRNASRNIGRSLLTLGLLAFATFLLVAVEVFRRSPPGSGKDPSSPKNALGGCALWVEMDIPIFERPDKAEGRFGWLDAIERKYSADPARAATERKKAKDLLDQCVFFPFRLAGEDNAGCLNLYQPGQPRVLGAPSTLLEEEGFQFASSLTPQAPWSPLLTDGKGEVSAVGEASAIQWILKSSLGGEVGVGGGGKVRVAGLLHDSPFQSELVVGEVSFRRLFPDREGWQVLLVRCPAGEEQRVAELLNLALVDQGVEVEENRLRVAKALGVENTYLTVFQALGGLGLILGTVGLGVVLLRGVWERRKEFALLGAIGYRPGDIGRLLLIETLILLFGGLGLGFVCALVSVLPHAGNLAANVPGLLVQLGACLGTGLVAGAFACRAAMRVPLLAGLRAE